VFLKEYIHHIFLEFLFVQISQTRTKMEVSEVLEFVQQVTADLTLFGILYLAITLTPGKCMEL
jgi:hypothetical protein